VTDKPIKLFGTIPRPGYNFGAELMKHALCDLEENISVDDRYYVKITYCKDHGLSFVYDGGLVLTKGKRGGYEAE